MKAKILCSLGVLLGMSIPAHPASAASTTRWVGEYDLASSVMIAANIQTPTSPPHLSNPLSGDGIEYAWVMENGSWAGGAWWVQVGVWGDGYTFAQAYVEGPGGWIVGHPYGTKQVPGSVHRYEVIAVGGDWWQIVEDGHILDEFNMPSGAEGNAQVAVETTNHVTIADETISNVSMVDCHQVVAPPFTLHTNGCGQFLVHDTKMDTK